MQSTDLALNIEDEYARYTKGTKYHTFMNVSKTNLWVEFLGTFAFVYFGNWSFTIYMMHAQSVANFALLQGMLVFILNTLAITRSGALFNPAITLSFMIIGKMKNHVALSYMFVQFLAACFACMCVQAHLPAAITEKLIENGAAPGLPSPVNEHQNRMILSNSVVGSMILSILYMAVYLNRDFDMKLAPAVFGMSYAMLTIIGVDLVGGNFNPVGLMPGFFYTDFSDKQMIMALGPWLGCTIGCLLYKYLIATEDPKELFADDEDDF